jgi:antitoxin Phd
MPWQVQDAKARFSEFLNQTLNEGPQVVTRRGVETAVLVSIQEWRRLTATRPSFKDVLLADEPKFDLPLPKRGRFKLRPPVVFD